MLLQSLLRPVLTPIMRGIFDPAQSVSAAWSPLSLWPDGISSAGMWISPRTLDSEWQDYTGTTPVAVPGTVADSSNPVGLALDIRAGATVLTDPGNHMLQSTSAARPLMSAYDGQTLGPGDTYDATGYPAFQLYDGVDDGMATAAFAAGTLTSGMDCMIVVRRDSGTTFNIAGICCSPAINSIIGVYDSSDSSTPSYQNCGTPTVWIDGVQIASNRAALYNALPLGELHILEYRGIDMSLWTTIQFSGLASIYFFPGARGDILLYPSTASTADKDAARQYLATYYGVTLP